MSSVWQDRVEIVTASAVSLWPCLWGSPLRQTSVVCSLSKLALLTTVYVYLKSSIEAVAMLCRNFQ